LKIDLPQLTATFLQLRTAAHLLHLSGFRHIHLFLFVNASGSKILNFGIVQRDHSSGRCCCRS
jgi:hypothetical protein